MVIFESSDTQGSDRDGSRGDAACFGVLAPLVAGMSEAEIDALAARAEAYVQESQERTSDAAGALGSAA